MLNMFLLGPLSTRSHRTSKSCPLDLLGKYVESQRFLNRKAVCCRVNPVFRYEKRSAWHRSESVWFGSYFRFTNRNCNRNHNHNHKPTRTTRTARAARTTRTTRNTQDNHNRNSKGSQEQQEDHNCLRYFGGEMLQISLQTTGWSSKMQNPTSMFQNIANTAQNKKPNVKNSGKHLAKWEMEHPMRCK